MTKLDQNFDLWTGTDRTLAYSITNASGASQNMSGFTAQFLLMDEPGSASLLRLRTSGSGVTISTSVVSVVLAASLTAGCNLSGTYYTELSASDSSGNADVMAVGYVTINKKG
jgi:hypothetical protein